MFNVSSTIAGRIVQKLRRSDISRTAVAVVVGGFRILSNDIGMNSTKHVVGLSLSLSNIYNNSPSISANSLGATLQSAT
jgi:hypothetical protein